MEGYAKTVYLGLGSNLGDREDFIKKALAEVEEEGIRVVQRSPLYETAPVGTTAGRWFLNCVVEAETDLMPLGLLHLTQKIERKLGRRPPAAPQPLGRTIDIDILLFGSGTVNLPELVIPHPRMTERRFVLEPLQDIAPELRHPVTRLSSAEMLGALGPGPAVRRIG
jgi:2-amino-4-hydroxy-6-hydroxymethyldihydropteridine diphosphokinase